MPSFPYRHTPNTKEQIRLSFARHSSHEVCRPMFFKRPPEALPVIAGPVRQMVGAVVLQQTSGPFVLSKCLCRSGSLESRRLTRTLRDNTCLSLMNHLINGMILLIPTNV